MTKIEKAASELQKLYAKRADLFRQIVAAEKKLLNEAKAVAKSAAPAKKKAAPKPKAKPLLKK